AGLGALERAQVLRALEDSDARVREHALRLAEHVESAPEIRAKLDQMTDDPALPVRYQLAFSLGVVQGEMPARALTRLALRDGADSWVRLAILTSTGN